MSSIISGSTVCEIASSTWRTTLNIIVSTPRLLASVCLVPLANSTPNLETYNFIACIFDFLLLILLRWAPESPQWLLYNRKIPLAEKIIIKAAKVNNISICSNFKIRPVNHRAYHCLDESQTCVGFLGGCNIILVLMEWFQFNDSISDVLTSISLGTGLIIHGLILNITPRIFAINVRCTLFGCCHSSGQLGSIICYLIVAFRAFEDIIYILIEATIAIGLLILCYVLPDVDGRELPDVIGDMDYFSELSKPLRWATQKTNSPSHEELEIRVYSFGSSGQNPSVNNPSNERLPAEKIGFKQLIRHFLQSCINNTRRILHKK
ncbi:unnamed protein product [Euphydryas editha]|uniref:Uncharacterized protein n=1 Tax=Euphydryas editha TaxID=104508 RepID=A0AAU9TH06_EUPED|nr:unnamed protein product [Euphydryas editha]